MKVLFVAARLPKSNAPGTNVPAKRQMKSLMPMLDKGEIYQIKGVPVIKYLLAIIAIHFKAKNYDIIHAHYGVCGFFAVIATRKPVVVSAMGNDLLPSPSISTIREKLVMFIEHLLTRFAIRRAAAVIAKSRELAEASPSSSVHVIPNGVDINLFSPRSKAEARIHLRIPEDSYVVFFGGNPSDSRKNFPLAEEAIAECKNIMKSANVEVLILSNIEPDMVPVYLNACDCLLFTSLLEGSPNIVKEAMACNTPIVSVPVGDTQYLLSDVSESYICDYNYRELSQALVDIFSSRKRSNGRMSLIEKKLDINHAAERIVKVYKTVLEVREQGPV